MCYHTCHAVQHYTQCKSLLSYICKPTMRCAKLGDTFSQVLQQLEVFFIGNGKFWANLYFSYVFLCFFLKWEMPSGPGDPRSSGFSSCVSAYFFVYGSPKPCLRLYRGHCCHSNGMRCSMLLSPVMVFCIIATVRTGQSPVQFTLMVPMRAFPFLDNQSTRFNELNRFSKVR